MRVLIVEDDMAVAGGLAPLVTGSGHDLVGLAADRDTAVALLASTAVDLALIDLHLADGWTGAEVARAAADAGVAAVFTTANLQLLPDDFAGACGLIAKPYSAAGLKAALGYVSARIAGEHAGETPRGLTLSPDWSGVAPAPG